MTSANLSLAEKIKNHKKYIIRTLWTAIIGFVLMAFYYIVGNVLMLSRSINYAKMYNQTAEVLQVEKYKTVVRIMGTDQLGFAIIMFIAIAFAFQGFSYVFDQKKIDFFLSQPTTRGQRLRQNYYNAITTFAFIYVLVCALAFIIAAAFGALNKYVLMICLIEMLRNLIFFFAIYNISVLAILLSGTLPVAMLLNVFFLGVTAVLGYEFIGFKRIFFSTYYIDTPEVIYASPLYDRLSVFDSMNKSLDMEGVKNTIVEILPGTIDTLVVAIVILILIDISSRYRKAEHAGKTVCYLPFRWLLKVTCCVIAGMAGGLLFHSIYDYVWNNSMYMGMLVAMVISTVLAAFVIEAILENNFRKFAKGGAQTVMALALVALIFVIFRGDLLGYDSYVPDAKKVSSCALIDDSSTFQVYYENGYPYINTQGDNMYLTNVNDIIEISKIGMKTLKENHIRTANGEYSDSGRYMHVLYRLKNGKKVYRTICIPYDIDSALISRVVDSEEYKHGAFNVFHDEKVRKEIGNLKDKKLTYSNSIVSKYVNEFDYAMLSDAYRKDIEENYSYELVSNSLPIGSITFDASSTYQRLMNTTTTIGYAVIDLNVYENYTNTISYLKKCGIYSENTLDVKYIDSVVVTNLYPGHDANTEPLNYLYSEDFETIEKTYTDEASIKEICDNAVYNGFYDVWYNYRDNSDNQYMIEFILKDPKDDFGTKNTYCSFRMGKVPDFVKADTN